MNGILTLFALLGTFLVAALFGPYTGGSLPPNIAWIAPAVPVLFWVGVYLVVVGLMTLLFVGPGFYLGHLIIVLATFGAWMGFISLPPVLAPMLSDLPIAGGVVVVVGVLLFLLA